MQLASEKQKYRATMLSFIASLKFEAICYQDIKLFGLFYFMSLLVVRMTVIQKYLISIINDLLGYI